MTQIVPHWPETFALIRDYCRRAQRSSIVVATAIVDGTLDAAQLLNENAVRQKPWRFPRSRDARRDCADPWTGPNIAGSGPFWGAWVENPEDHCAQLLLTPVLRCRFANTAVVVSDNLMRNLIQFHIRVL